MLENLDNGLSDFTLYNTNKQNSIAHSDKNPNYVFYQSKYGTRIEIIHSSKNWKNYGLFMNGAKSNYLSRFGYRRSFMSCVFRLRYFHFFFGYWLLSLVWISGNLSSKIGREWPGIWGWFPNHHPGILDLVPRLWFPNIDQYIRWRINQLPVSLNQPTNEYTFQETVDQLGTSMPGSWSVFHAYNEFTINLIDTFIATRARAVFNGIIAKRSVYISLFFLGH